MAAQSVLRADELEAADQDVLERVYQRLEFPSLAARLTSTLGTPIETGLERLPAHWRSRVHAVAETSLRKALDTAIHSVHLRPGRWPTKTLGVASGALGGWFGAPALVLELPVSTMIILRSIAQMARAEGEDLARLEGRLACMEVFALGGRAGSDDAAETGYYGVRLALAVHLSSLARSGGQAGSLAMGRLIQALAQRFGVVVSQKLAAGMVPVISAAGAAAVNALFVQHFEDMAKGHFALRRLERKYGRDLVEREYRALALRLR